MLVAYSRALSFLFSAGIQTAKDNVMLRTSELPRQPHNRNIYGLSSRYMSLARNDISTESRFVLSGIGKDDVPLSRRINIAQTTHLGSHSAYA
jgi:hypothetical protein